MNLLSVDRIVHALLYEGYILYPYRASSVKNRMRFNFGVLYPRQYAEAQSEADACTMQTEVPGVREGSQLARDLSPFSAHREPRGWADRRKLAGGGSSAGSISPSGRFELFPPKRSGRIFPASGTRGGRRDRPHTAGDPWRGRSRGRSRLRAAWRVTARIGNTTELPGESGGRREIALPYSLISTHTVLGIEDGDFVSLLEPPSELRQAASECRNEGTWPVLAGDAGVRDTVLSSPIILYDYPAIAPESPGDLFDGTEIDEILTLRLLTMSDQEKQEACRIDEHGRRILQRAELLDAEQFSKLHGTFRGVGMSS